MNIRMFAGCAIDYGASHMGRKIGESIHQGQGQCAKLAQALRLLFPKKQCLIFPNLGFDLRVVRQDVAADLVIP